MIELWKDIIGFNGNYQVSTFGQVRSKKSHRILCVTVSSRGYNIIGLQENKKRISNRVHRLVAKAFIPNPLNKPQINHIDGNKINNTVSNLEWCTRSENMKHAYHVLKTIKRPLGGAGNNHKSVLQYSLDGNHIGKWESITKASKKTGIKICCISSACLGNQKAAGGFIWKSG